MAYKDPKDRKKQEAPKRGTPEHKRKMELQRARRAIDSKDTGSVHRKSPKRKGKDVSHKKALAKGGTNKDGVFLECPSKNRARNGKKKKK